MSRLLVARDSGGTMTDEVVADEKRDADDREAVTDPGTSPHPAQKGGDTS